MDLAQIRKKAREAKKEGAAQEPRQQAAADAGEPYAEPVPEAAPSSSPEPAAFPGESDEEPFQDIFAAELEKIAPPEDFAWDEDDEPPAEETGEPEPPVPAVPVRDLPPEDAPEYDAPVAAAPMEPPATDPSAPAVTFDPVALILSGREAAREGDDAVYVAQSDEKDGIREFLCFRVAREEYAIDIMEIKEIIKPRDVTEVPRSPQFISGIISLRGLILPVFDIALRLGFSKDYCTGKERVVVVRRGEGYCGIMVDEVRQVVRLAENVLEPPPPVLDGIDRDFVTGIGRHGDRMLILLNMEKVLDINVR